MSAQRIFDGKVYKEYTAVPKREAKGYAKMLRDQGWNVRVVEHAHSSTVYVRKRAPIY